MQGFIAVIIAVNFLAIIVEKEIDPYDVRYQRFTTTWDIIDYASNIVFILELLLNLYGSYWKPLSPTRGMRSTSPSSPPAS